MEDERIARGKFGSPKIVDTTAVSTPFVGPNPRRTALIVSAPPIGQTTLSTDAVAVINRGINVYASTVPVVIDNKTYGNIVTKAWSAVSSAALAIYVVEVELPEE